MTLLIGFGAINTGNNLLYLLLGMMLALIILSGILSESVLQKIQVQRTLPDRIFAGQPALTEILLRNNKGRAPSFSIQVIERIAHIGEKNRPAAYFMKVGPGQEERAQYRFSYPHRGRWKIEGVEVATRFPFELFRKSRDFDEEQEVVVFPTPELPGSLTGIASRPQGDVRRHKVGMGSEFHGMRDYREGDDARDIHWKTSARRGSLVLREFEEEEARQITLCLDHRWEPGMGVADEDHRNALERAIRLGAGVAQDLLSRGYVVGLATLDGKISPGAGAGQFERILHHLALLRIHGDPRDEQAPALQPSPTFPHMEPEEACLLVSASPVPPGLGHARLIKRVEG